MNVVMRVISYLLPCTISHSASSFSTLYNPMENLLPINPMLVCLKMSFGFTSTSLLYILNDFTEQNRAQGKKKAASKEKLLLLIGVIKKNKHGIY